MTTGAADSGVAALRARASAAAARAIFARTRDLARVSNVAGAPAQRDRKQNAEPVLCCHDMVLAGQRPVYQMSHA